VLEVRKKGKAGKHANQGHYGPKRQRGEPKGKVEAKRAAEASRLLACIKYQSILVQERALPTMMGYW